MEPADGASCGIPVRARRVWDCGVMSDDEPAPMTRDDVDALCLALPEVTNAQMGKSTIGATSTTAR